MKKIKSYTSIWSVEKVIYAINMSQKTFDGKKPYGFLKSIITYMVKSKVTYAGKPVKLYNQRFDETITIVRSEMYYGVPN